MGREQCRTMTQYLYSCTKPRQTWSTLFYLQVHLFFLRSESSSMSGSRYGQSPLPGSAGYNVYFILIGDPLEPQLLSYWILMTQYLWDNPHVWFVTKLRTSFTYLVAPKHSPPIPSRPSQECVRRVDFRDLTKNHEFPFKGFSPNHCFFILSMINARFGMFGQYH